MARLNYRSSSFIYEANIDWGVHFKMFLNHIKIRKIRFYMILQCPQSSLSFMLILFLHTTALLLLLPTVIPITYIIYKIYK